MIIDTESLLHSTRFVIEKNKSVIHEVQISNIAISCWEGMFGKHCVQLNFKTTNRELPDYTIGALVEGLYEHFETYEEAKQAIIDRL